MFIGCKFNQVEISGVTNGIDFFECIKDGLPFDPNAQEEFIDGDSLEQKESLDLEILRKYIPKGGKGRKMQIISRLKTEFDNGKAFKKVFCSLVASGFILTNGDQSHISDAGLEYLTKHF